MAYIQNSEIGTRVGSQSLVQLADDDGDNVADAAVVDEVRIAAEGEVNSHLATRFAVPIDTTTHPELAGLLASLTLDLAEYRLRQRRPPVPQECERKRKHTLDLLRRFSSGELDLPSSVRVEPSSLRGSLATTTGNARILSREELSGYQRRFYLGSRCLSHDDEPSDAFLRAATVRERTRAELNDRSGNGNWLWTRLRDTQTFLVRGT